MNPVSIRCIFELKKGRPCSTHSVMKTRIAGLLAFLLVCSSCATTGYHEIGYEMSGIPAPSSSPVFPLHLGVLRLTDKARSVQTTEGTVYNERARYVHRDLGEGISKMIAKHLEAERLFEKVSYDGRDVGLVLEPQGDPDVASQYDAVLSGEVERFEGWVEQPFDQVASLVIVLIGGIIGGLIYLAVMKGQGKDYGGQTVLSNLKLVNARDGRILWEGSAEGRVSGSRSGQSTPYDVADKSLKQATVELIKNLKAVSLGSLQPKEVMS